MAGILQLKGGLEASISDARDLMPGQFVIHRHQVVKLVQRFKVHQVGRTRAWEWEVVDHAGETRMIMIRNVSVYLVNVTAFKALPKVWRKAG